MINTDLGVEGRRAAIEIIATLVHIKATMVKLILRPAGVPQDITQNLLYRRDPTTGRVLSKRQMAPLILDAIDKRSDCNLILRRIIEIGANWGNFHLANDEYAARATVQKAREILGSIELMEAREKKQRELAREQELARMEQERTQMFRQQRELLLMMFDDLAKSDNPQQRGLLLEDLLTRVFDLFSIPIIGSFRRNDGGEQIDGSFRLEGWHYLVECKWQTKPSDIRQLDSLYGKVDRSGKQVMGMFLSINGWSENVPTLLKQNPNKCIILMDGYDLRCVLDGQIKLTDFLLTKVGKLNDESEPYFGAWQYLNR